MDTLKQVFPYISLYLGHSQKVPYTMGEVLLPSEIFLEVSSEIHPEANFLVDFTKLTFKIKHCISLQLVKGESDTILLASVRKLGLTERWAWKL